MAISDNIRAKANAVRDEKAASENEVSATAQDLHAKATKAIVGGVADWVAYMQLFADPNDPAQLARLIPTDGTDDDDRQSARAYLVRNGMCTEETTEMLTDHVTTTLD